MLPKRPPPGARTVHNNNINNNDGIRRRQKTSIQQSQPWHTPWHPSTSPCRPSLRHGLFESARRPYATGGSGPHFPWWEGGENLNGAGGVLPKLFEHSSLWLMERQKIHNNQPRWLPRRTIAKRVWRGMRWDEPGYRSSPLQRARQSNKQWINK